MGGADKKTLLCDIHIYADEKMCRTIRDSVPRPLQQSGRPVAPVGQGFQAHVKAESLTRAIRHVAMHEASWSMGHRYPRQALARL